MSDNKNSWAVLLGAAAGVTAVSIGVAWYLKSRSEGTTQPIRDVQDAIGRAYDKIKEIEQIALLRYSQ